MSVFQTDIILKQYSEKKKKCGNGQLLDVINSSQCSFRIVRGYVEFPCVCLAFVCVAVAQEVQLIIDLMISGFISVAQVTLSKNLKLLSMYKWLAPKNCQAVGTLHYQCMNMSGERDM